MGSCLPVSKNKIIALNLDQISRYPRTVKVSIKSTKLKTEESSIFTLNLTDPFLVNCKTLEQNNSKYWVSSCILPGQDPKSEYKKACQDSCIFLSNNNSILLGVFDGHGTEGERVANFCRTFVEKYFLEGLLPETENQDPTSFLIKLIEDCDEELKLKGFDILYSGSTAVIALVANGIIYSASVGDSRAVLGSASPTSVPPGPTLITEERKVLKNVKFRRGSKSTPLVFPLQLTKDQKPNDSEEFERIIKSGGRVQRLLDENGKRIGPYRVWENNTNAPGLVISRSIGDIIGKKIGVISTPLCNTHKLNQETDFFLVLASDGIWDVMENEDVINFIECFRGKCKNENLKSRFNNVDVVPSNSCIAQLICEEARVRWLSIVEEEDVMIDDISCIVLEFIKSQAPSEFRPVRNLINEEITFEGETKQIGVRRAPTLKDIVTRDPRRGSLVLDKITF